MRTAACSWRRTSSATTCSISWRLRAGATRTAPSNGLLRALLTRDQLLSNATVVSVLTDIAWRYTRVKPGESGVADNLVRLNDIARVLIEEDLDGDGVVDHRDLAAFDPRSDTDALAFDYDDLADRGRFDDFTSVLDVYRGVFDADAESLLTAKLHAIFAGRLSAFTLPDSRATAVTVTLVPFGNGCRALDGPPLRLPPRCRGDVRRTGARLPARFDEAALRGNAAKRFPGAGLGRLRRDPVQPGMHGVPAPGPHRRGDVRLRVGDRGRRLRRFDVRLEPDGREHFDRGDRQRRAGGDHPRPGRQDGRLGRVRAATRGGGERDRDAPLRTGDEPGEPRGHHPRRHAAGHQGAGRRRPGRTRRGRRASRGRRRCSRRWPGRTRSVRRPARRSRATTRACRSSGPTTRPRTVS